MSLKIRLNQLQRKASKKTQRTGTRDFAAEEAKRWEMTERIFEPTPEDKGEEDLPRFFRAKCGMVLNSPFIGVATVASMAPSAARSCWSLDLRPAPASFGARANGQHERFVNRKFELGAQFKSALERDIVE